MRNFSHLTSTVSSLHSPFSFYQWVDLVRYALVKCWPTSYSPLHGPDWYQG